MQAEELLNWTASCVLSEENQGLLIYQSPVWAESRRASFTVSHRRRERSKKQVWKFPGGSSFISNTATPGSLTSPLIDAKAQALLSSIQTSNQARKQASKQESKQRYHSNKEGAKRVKSEHFWPTTAVATDYFWWSSATTTEVWWQRVEKTQREPETTTKSKSSQQSNSAGVQET